MVIQLPKDESYNQKLNPITSFIWGKTMKQEVILASFFHTR